jgi:hypothetical protein
LFSLSKIPSCQLLWPCVCPVLNIFQGVCCWWGFNGGLFHSQDPSGDSQDVHNLSFSFRFSFSFYFFSFFKI